MAKIKEIKKIEAPIKEIKKPKVESLDDEVEEEAQYNNYDENVWVKRSNKTSTLEATEAQQDTVVDRERAPSKEDEKEIRFRQSYTSSQNSGSAYTPVGAAESGGAGQVRTLGEERGRDRPYQQTQNQETGRQQQGGERGEIIYQDRTQENDERRERKRNM